jgi:hypothetical protein
VPVRLQETLLRQRLRQVNVARRRKQKPEDLRAVLRDDSRKLLGGNSCAVAMVIASNAVPAAITQVDARTGCKFTASAAFLIDINYSKLVILPTPRLRC